MCLYCPRQPGRATPPGGFAGAVPLERQGSSFVRLGLMSQDRSRERFRAFASLVSDRAGRDLSAIPSPRLKMLPLAPVPRTYGDRVVAVGDAAGLVKPTTGGGIYYGLISGALAAEVLAQGLSRDPLHARSLEVYKALFQATTVSSKFATAQAIPVDRVRAFLPK